MQKKTDKTQYFFMIKTLSKLGKEWNFLNRIKVTCEKPTTPMTLSGERLKAFPLG